MNAPQERKEKNEYLRNIYYVSGTMLRVLLVLTHLIVQT
jgi:hypothetical protein